MRARFLISLFITGVLALAYWYASAAGFCPVPIVYSIGAVDERFAFSAEELAAVAKEAETIWEDAVGRDLFTYNPKSSFSINLIYDERQQRTHTEEEWRLRLDAAQREYEAERKEIEGLAARYETETASYTERRTEYETALDEYNQEVERYNKDGGAPREEYERLEKEAAALKEQLRTLNSRESDLNRLAAELNTKGEAANARIAAYNEEVSEYNEIFGTRETFTQGDYERERINIYKFSERDELLRVIVHEFGHALGIGHVEEESAVMYYLMTEQNSSVLTAADIEAFTALCGREETFPTAVRRFIATLFP